jgi:hypothetical protein
VCTGTPDEQTVKLGWKWNEWLSPGLRRAHDGGGGVQTDGVVVRYRGNTDAKVADASGAAAAAAAAAAPGRLGSPHAGRRRQGLTIVHFSAQRERFLSDKGCLGY